MTSVWAFERLVVPCPDTKKTGGGAGLGRVYFWAHFEDPELEGAWI